MNNVKDDETKFIIDRENDKEKIVTSIFYLLLRNLVQLVKINIMKSLPTSAICIF